MTDLLICVAAAIAAGQLLGLGHVWTAAPLFWAAATSGTRASRYWRARRAGRALIAGAARREWQRTWRDAQALGRRRAR